MYISMVVRWGFQEGCLHSYGCVLEVSKGMSTLCAGSFKRDVYIAMVVCWKFQKGCLHSYGCVLGVQEGCLHSYGCVLEVSKGMST